MDYRIEHDSLGELPVPADAYWGINTQRAIGNFPVSGITDSQHPNLIRAYATVKRACAEANDELGLLDHDRASSAPAPKPTTSSVCSTTTVRDSSKPPAWRWNQANSPTSSPSTSCRAAPAPPPT